MLIWLVHGVFVYVWFVDCWKCWLAYLDHCDVELFALEMKQDHSITFEIVSNYCILESFDAYEGCSILSKGFLSIVVDIMVIWVTFTCSHPFKFTDTKMLMFTLAISYVTTSKLPWFMDLTFHVPMQYCSLQHHTFTTRHVHNQASFLLWLSLFILSEAIYPLFPSSILGTYQPGGLIFQCHTFCLFILFMGFTRQENWSGLPLPSPVDHIFSGPN